jgi:signal transduction histidine kinase
MTTHTTTARPTFLPHLSPYVATGEAREPGAVVVVDEGGRVRWIGAAGRRLLGFAAGALDGRALHQAVHQPHHAGACCPLGDCPVHQALLDGQPRLGCRERLWRSDGRPLDVILDCVPLPGPRGRARGVRVRIRAVEPPAGGELDFLASTHHELGNAIHAATGMFDLFLEVGGADLKPEAAALAASTARHLASVRRLVGDLADDVAIRTGRFTVHRRPCDAGKLASQAVAGLQALAAERGLALEARVEAAPVQADADRIGQVLANLLGNAIKFADAGTAVTLGCRQAGPVVRLEVGNQGQPIPLADRERIFRRWERAAKGAAPGRGLGLAIVRQIVAAHDGAVGLEDAADGRTVFWVELPADRGRGMEPGTPTATR